MHACAHCGRTFAHEAGIFKHRGACNEWRSFARPPRGRTVRRHAPGQTLRLPTPGIKPCDRYIAPFSIPDKLASPGL